LSARHTNPAKLREYGEKRDDAGRIIKRAFPIAKIEKGSEVKLKFSTDTKTTGTYSVIELDDLIPSHIEEVENPNHFVPEAQPKDRGSGDSSRKSREDIARELDPGDITRYTGNPYFGAPSINARGEVIQGNNRSDALRYTFNAYPGNYEKYRKYLLDNAETFGLSKDKLSKFKTPILVNLIDVADETMIELGQFSELDLTTGGKQDLDAKRIYNKMQDDDFSKLVNMIFSQEGSTKELIRQNGVGAVYYLLRKGYISQAQYDSAINSKTKMLTKDAVEEIQFLVTFQLFKNAPNGITIMFNQLQNNIQNVLLKNSQKIGEQKLQDRSIVKELQAAIVGYDEFKASGIKSFNAWIGQNDFINEGTPQERYSPLTLHFIEQFTQSHTAGWMKEFSNKLIDYNKSVLGDSEEENVFIPRTPLSKEDAIKTVFMEDNTDANRIRAINVGNKKKTVKKQIHQVNSEGKSAPNKKKIAELGEQLNILNAIETELKDENYVRPERIIDTTLIKTRTARRMFKKIMRDPRGKEIGVRSIMKYLVTNLPVEVRIRNEQISHQHPALYDTYGDFIRASTLSSGSYILHEAGHAIWEMMINKDKSALVSVRKTLKMITEMKNTHASANNAHEGFAEWVRRFVAYPETISDLRVNREIESYISAKYPEIWTLLKEVQQLEGAHSNRSTDAVFRSYSSDIPPVPKFSLRQAVDTIMFSAAKGWGIERTQRNLIKEMIRSEMAKGATRKSAMETARKWLKDVNENGNLQLAYHNIVRLPISIIEALQAEVGLRVKNSKGEYSKIREKNFGDIKKAVGDNRWSDFDNYIKAKVSLERYNKKGIRYPGQSDKITPKELENTVDFYEKEFPDFLQISKDLKDFTDGLVDISVLSGEKSPEEGKTIKESYELYANLRRVIQKWDVSHLSGLGNHTNPSSGYQSLRQGSANPYIDFETGIRDVVRTTFTAYYYNQLINTMVDVFEGIQKNPDLSWEVKTLAGSILSPLKLDLKVPVSLTPDEQRLIILKGINQIILNRQIKAGMEATGLSKEELKEQHPEYFTIKDKGKLELDDIQLFLANKPIFRRVKPNALNVIVYHRDGANHYLQIEDPFLFGVFAASPDAGGMLGQILKQTKVALTEVKRPVTSSLPFFIRNVFYRNPLTSILMGDDNKSLFVPFYHTLIGMFAKDKGKTEKIIGETFGRVIANRSKYPDDNYWGSIKNEIERIGITLKGYKNMSPPLKGIALLGFVVEMLVKPLNLTNAIFGLHIANLKGEEFVRRGAYLDAKMRGETDAKAEMWFDIIAGNFGEKGGFGWLAQLIGTFPFVNPAVQTLYQSTLKLTDPLAKSKNRFRLFWAGVIVPILLWLIKEAISTDEDRERMKERPEWDRYNTMDIKGLRIPFYPGGPLGILQSLTWNTLDNYTTERKIRDHKAFSVALAKKMAALPMPTQWFFAPYKAIIEVEWNHNFYLDRPVVPGWLSSLPKEEQIFYSTPEAYSTLYKAIGKFANYSPIELQHIVKSGIAQDYDEILSMLDKMKDGRLSLQYLQDNPAEIPFMSRIFIKNPMGRGSASAEELNRQIEKAPQKIQKIAEAMTKKYGNDYKNTEEYKLLVAQLQHAQNLENALEEIKKLDALIKVQRKLPEPDWRLIYAEKSQMSRIASDAMLGIKKE